MKGIVFNLLEELVTRDHGADTWDDLLDAAGLDGAYTSLGNYDDAQLHALVGAAAKALDTPPHDIIRWFGQEAIPLFAALYPQFFEGHPSTLPFLLTLNDIIHPEVRKLYPGASVPEFDFERDGDDCLKIGYRSAKGLCAFAEGLIIGAAAHYGEAVRIDQATCMAKGDDHCVLTCSFDGGAA